MRPKRRVSHKDGANALLFQVAPLICVHSLSGLAASRMVSLSSGLSRAAGTIQNELALTFLRGMCQRPGIAGATFICRKDDDGVVLF